jgi:hypothetical protein
LFWFAVARFEGLSFVEQLTILVTKNSFPLVRLARLSEYLSQRS